ncbi:uncharacterized membrane protein YuiD [Impatiens glandulifera]|uniref:uncharacterized membrane protein YuiD n=1 Tax=Impatiens glandulifera TaxID=253017 RepID=UPI001FB17597|nr:uncharacterized membrane protein YuiD [Impatiens glandulifera]
MKRRDRDMSWSSPLHFSSFSCSSLSSSSYICRLGSRNPVGTELNCRTVVNSGYSSRIVCSNSGINEIVEISHNKVLIAASISAVIGQMLKPFASSILYGKKRSKFDLKTVFQSGGFPSTHSSAVVATATSIGLERGFSDSIFGLAVVYACLIMYDAQGVRREVGKHAKVLNKLIKEKRRFDDWDLRLSPNDRFGEVTSCSSRVSTKLKKGIVGEEGASSAGDGEEKMVVEECEQKSDHEGMLMKESVGHTEIEVMAGALLGLLVTFTLYAF